MAQLERFAGSTKEGPHAENYRRRPGFHGWRHASARRVDRGSDQGFKFGGGSMPYFDQAFGEEIDRVFKEFDLLLGRKTYEIFAAYWPRAALNSSTRCSLTTSSTL
jgi:hypothetical protein